MKLSRISVDQFRKIVKVSLYVGISAVISYLLAEVANDPDLFGPLTPVVNVVLVVIKQAFTRPE